MARVTLQPNSLTTVTNTYAVTGGSLPSGMALNSSTGVISGTPSTVGYNVSGVASTFDITATTSVGGTSVTTFTITRKWTDGSNRTQAAPNAQYIRSLGITTDDNFWLQPTGCPRPFISHCYNSLESGGWQLALRLQTNITANASYGQNENFVSSWEGWGYGTQDQIENLGLSPVSTADRDAFSPSFAYSGFTDVMVIANDSAQIAKRLGWRHTTPITSMLSVTGLKNTETIGNTVLFGSPTTWLTSLHVRGDTSLMTGGTRYGFKLRSDTGSSVNSRNFFGGIQGTSRESQTEHTGHYYCMIGCGRENSNSGQWGGGIGGCYNSDVKHRMSGHWWNHGDSRFSGADRTDCFFGHAVYIRLP